MISCQDVDLRLIELLAGNPPPDLLFHLKSCPGCREKREKWAQIWSFMDRWEEEKPSDDIVEAIVSRVQRGLRTETAQGRQNPIHPQAETRATPGLGWWGSRVSVVLVSALIASLLSIGSSVAFHYGKAVQFIKFALQALEIPAYMPDSTIFFLVGCLYSLLPLLLVGLIFGRIADGHRLRLSFWMVAIFLLVTLPYTVVECSSFALGLALSLIAGLAVGALSGSAAGLYLRSRWPALVGQH